MGILERHLREAADISLSVASTHEIVFGRFMEALRDIYKKDPFEYKYSTLVLDSLVLYNIEPYLKVKDVPYRAKGFSAVDNNELPLRGYSVVSSDKVECLMNYGILHIEPDRDSEMFIYNFGPLDNMRRSITVAAYRRFEDVQDLIKGAKAHYAERIKNNRLILNGRDELPMEEVHWDDVILPEDQYSKIRISIESFLNSKNVYERLDIPYKRGILLAGAPGNGKTMLCKAIAWESRLPFILFPITDSASDYELDYTFEIAAEMAPAILCFEDLDAIKKTQISMSYFLNKIDGFKGLDGLLILATTNKPEDIDTALSNRPSRFDSVFRINNPDEQCRGRMLRKYFKDIFYKDFIDTLVSKTKDFTMAYLKELYLLSSMISLNRGVVTAGKEDVNEALEVLRQQILTGNKPLDEDRQFAGFRY